LIIGIRSQESGIRRQQSVTVPFNPARELFITVH
jgi:hypothetical protein